jgi:lipoyl(octanoyl) transferase
VFFLRYSPIQQLIWILSQERSNFGRQFAWEEGRLAYFTIIASPKMVNHQEGFTTVTQSNQVPWIDLGRMDYQEAFDLQRQVQQEQIAGLRGPVVLFVEHPPTITVSRRSTDDEIVAPPMVLENRGVQVCKTDRGGQVTYHGPGQMVVYPLINVQDLGLHGYLRDLEETVIKTISTWGLEGSRVEGRTGVWIGRDKICAMGIHVRRWWATHGIALNVNTDLNHFGLIIPCGIRDRGVCSLKSLLAEKAPSMNEVKKEFQKSFSEIFRLEAVNGDRALLEQVAAKGS